MKAKVKQTGEIVDVNLIVAPIYKVSGSFGEHSEDEYAEDELEFLPECMTLSDVKDDIDEAFDNISDDEFCDMIDKCQTSEELEKDYEELKSMMSIYKKCWVEKKIKEIIRNLDSVLEEVRSSEKKHVMYALDRDCQIYVYDWYRNEKKYEMICIGYESNEEQPVVINIRPYDKIAQVSCDEQHGFSKSEFEYTLRECLPDYFI